ncbi:MAG: DUF3179 domain-containing protein [bacterium]
MIKKLFFLPVSLVVAMTFSCGAGEDIARPTSADWLVYPVVSGGVAKDGIPALNNPETIPAAAASYLTDEALVIGLVVSGQPRAYPHAILDWHEVVNEDFSGKPVVISYCPLTGTSLVFERTVNGRVLNFGVSGLLHNSNLIMFDRQTDSHWTQMRMQSDEGELVDTNLKVYPSIETTWATWKKLFPNTVVLSTNTGHERTYTAGQSFYALQGYSNIHEPPWFAVTHEDKRLPPKVRVHGIIFKSTLENSPTKTYIILDQQKKRVINDSFVDIPVLVIDDGMDNFVVSYTRVVSGTILTFRLSDDNQGFPFHIKDNETESTWNLLGEAIDGPLLGTKLEKTLSYNAYWFAWGAFYRNAEIHD